jgi:PAS domain S-box-containing protein
LRSEIGTTPYWKRLESWFLAAAFLILAVTCFGAWRNWQDFASIQARAQAARGAIDQMEGVEVAVREAESSLRGFLLTDQKPYLESFETAVLSLPAQVARIDELVPAQKQPVQQIGRLIQQKITELRQTIALRRARGRDAASEVVLTDRGLELTNRILVATRQFRQVEMASYQAEAAAISRLETQILYVSLGGDLLLCVLLCLAAISLHTGAERREEYVGARKEDQRLLTELRQTAEAAEERVRHILESIGDGFVSVDCDWKITYCNAEAAKLLGIPASEILSKSFWIVFPDAAAPELQTRYHEAMTNQEQVIFDLFIKSQNSYWEQRLDPAQDGLGVYVQDVTERRRFEERTRHTQKLESLGVLAGGIAHDFNNLLTAILGSASLIQEELPQDSPLRPFADNVIHASERAGQLTRQMLVYSGQGRLVMEPIDLTVQISEISVLLETSITPQVELVLDLSTEGVLIEGDSGQIQQLVMNLAINGAEAIGPSGGRVTISTNLQQLDQQMMPENYTGNPIEPGTFVLLQVYDTGAGMDEATLARIFDPFFTTKFTGRGLGLAAALGIVRAHHGAIQVNSSPGRGTTFKVFFPVATGQTLTTRVPRISDYHGSATVLVVDDEAVVQKLAFSTLDRYGYRVQLASNGREALDILTAPGDRTSLVLLDMTMPVMSGEETLSRLRVLRPGVKVIASSGYNEMEAILRFGDDIAGFLQKPYRASQLLEKVKTTLTRSRQPDPGTIPRSYRND